MNSNFWTKSVHWSSFSFLIFRTGSSCQYRYDSQAFLFSLVNKPGWAPVKLPQTGQYSSNRYSIYDCSSYGPTFGGGHDIYIANYASSSSSSHANLGYAYSPPSGYSYGSTFARTFLAGGSNDHFTSDEIETFYETTWKLLHRIQLKILRYYTVLSRGNTFFLTRQYKKKYILICKFNIEAWKVSYSTKLVPSY